MAWRAAVICTERGTAVERYCVVMRIWGRIIQGHYEG
jgi:hypothetical protein